MKISIQHLLKLRSLMLSPGLELTTTSGCAGTVTNSGALIHTLINMAERCICLEKDLREPIDKGRPSDWNKGYQAGHKAGMRSISAYRNGRNQGRNDMKHRIRCHFSEEKISKELSKLIMEASERAPSHELY